MSEQPEALRLADELSRPWPRSSRQAAIELRRLHAENKALRALLLRIYEWDMMDVAGDWPHWRREIDKVINAARSKT